MFSSHPSEPMVNQRRFPDSAPRSNCNNIDLLVCPGIVQESDVLFTTKKITSCDGQSGYGNLLGYSSSWLFASSDTRDSRSCLLQALTGDSDPSIDSDYYCRNRLQKFIWALETKRRVFL